jgi:hypothetical protein
MNESVSDDDDEWMSERGMKMNEWVSDEDEWGSEGWMTQWVDDDDEWVSSEWWWLSEWVDDDEWVMVMMMSECVNGWWWWMSEWGMKMNEWGSDDDDEWVS